MKNWIKKILGISALESKIENLETAFKVLADTITVDVAVDMDSAPDRHAEAWAVICTRRGPGKQPLVRFINMSGMDDRRIMEIMDGIKNEAEKVYFCFDGPHHMRPFTSRLNSQ